MPNLHNQVKLFAYFTIEINLNGGKGLLQAGMIKEPSYQCLVYIGPLISQDI